MLEQLTSTGKNKMNIDLNFTRYTEINLKHITGLKCKTENFKKKIEKSLGSKGK